MAFGGFSFSNSSSLSVSQLCLSTAATCLLLVSVHDHAIASGMQLVLKNRPQAVIVIPDGASPQNLESAQLLAEYLAKSTGAKLGVVAESKADKERSQVHVGRTRFALGSGLSMDDLNDDGFVIGPKSEERLIIAGPTDWGTEFGVCEFLERFVGVRWLFPGELGTHVPSHTDIAGPDSPIQEEPASISRFMSGIPGGEQALWARRNRMHRTIAFQHNLLNIFSPKVYAASHPEFFPIRNGKRYLPDENVSDGWGWQPCLTADGVIEAAVDRINQYFRDHPEEQSCSLSVTDGGGHCECESCQSLDTGKNNFLGVRDVSDRYYEWCNQVVTRVLKTHPDKYFGCLAYYQVAAPPTRVKLHERLIPCMTFDRMRWANPKLEKNGHILTEEWHKASTSLGWYEYLYGTPYMLPRIYFHTMAANYRYAEQHGVVVHCAEAYPNWGEGPKLYLSLKLQWNPNQDVDLLLTDWYNACVGKQAAPYLEKYFQLWEEFWTSSELTNGHWFVASRAEYLNFYSPEYLDHVTEELLQKSRELLEATIAKAKAPEQRERAKLLLEAFDYYEASAYAYLLSQRKFKSIANENDALEFIDQSVKGRVMLEKRIDVLARLQNHPVLRHPLPISLRQYEALRSEAWGVGSLWPVYPWLEESPNVRRKVQEVSSSGWTVTAAQAKLMLEKWRESNRELTQLEQ